MAPIEFILMLVFAGALGVCGWCVGRWTGFERAAGMYVGDFEMRRHSAYEAGRRHGQFEARAVMAAHGYDVFPEASAPVGEASRKGDCPPGLMARTDGADALEDK